jgi:hypothetical protein
VLQPTAGVMLHEGGINGVLADELVRAVVVVVVG